MEDDDKLRRLWDLLEEGQVNAEGADTSDWRPKEATKGTVMGNPVILIIEDDLDMRAVVRTALQADYTLLEFESLDTARHALHLGLRADLIVMDIHFGSGSSGIGFVNKLRKDSRLSKMKVLLLSGDLNLAEISEAVQADGFLEKPCGTEQISTAVADVLKTA